MGAAVFNDCIERLAAAVDRRRTHPDPVVFAPLERLWTGGGAHHVRTVMRQYVRAADLAWDPTDADGLPPAVRAAIDTTSDRPVETWHPSASGSDGAMNVTRHALLFVLHHRPAAAFDRWPTHTFWTGWRPRLSAARTLLDQAFAATDPQWVARLAERFPHLDCVGWSPDGSSARAAIRPTQAPAARRVPNWEVVLPRVTARAHGAAPALLHAVRAYSAPEITEDPAALDVLIRHAAHAFRWDVMAWAVAHQHTPHRVAAVESAVLDARPKTFTGVGDPADLLSALWTRWGAPDWDTHSHLVRAHWRANSPQDRATPLGRLLLENYHPDRIEWREERDAPDALRWAAIHHHTDLIETWVRAGWEVPDAAWSAVDSAGATAESWGRWRSEMEALVLQRNAAGPTPKMPARKM